MDAVDNETDLDALRSAVLASIKLKSNSEIKPVRTDSELEELRKQALLSTKKQNEANLLKKSQPLPDTIRKRSTRNANLIVIQPLDNEEKSFSRSSSFSSQPIKLLRPQDAYCRLDEDKTCRSPETQPRPKGTDKFSRFESSSSSEDESDFSDSESVSTASDKQSNNSENKVVSELEEENEGDILLIQPDESFDDKFHEEANGENAEGKNSVKDTIVKDSRSALIDNKTVEKNNKCDVDKRQSNSKYEGSKRRHKDDPDRNLHRKHRKQDREVGEESGRDKRRHRKPKDKDRKAEERLKEKYDSNSRSKSSEEKEKEGGRIRLSSILSKPETGDGRISKSEIVRCNSVERSSGPNERQDLRDKLQRRKRTNNEMKSEGEEVESPKRKSVGEISEERRKKSKSPPIKSVLSVVKVGTESANSRKKTLENAQVTANGPIKSNESGQHIKTVFSPIRCEPSPERKVLIRSSRYHQNYSSDGDEVENSARVHITINDDTGKSKDVNVNPPPKPKLPVHLRLGSAPSTAIITKNNSSSDTGKPHSLKIRDFDKKRKSVSPAKSSTTSTSSSSKRSDRKTTSGTAVQPRQVVKLSGDRVRSIATILSKQNDHLTTNQMQQLTGKTYENQLDEKIRRIRVKNQAIMKRKSEIEREQHSNG